MPCWSWSTTWNLCVRPPIASRYCTRGVFCARAPSTWCSAIPVWSRSTWVEGIRSMLTIRSLNVSCGVSQVLWDVHLYVPPGQVVCLLGRNGVGKTTLLKSIMGLLTPRSGSITFNGQELTRLSPDERARRGIGYVPQGRDIFPDLTVQENLHLGLVAHAAHHGTI